MEQGNRDTSGIEAMMNAWTQPMNDIMGTVSQIWSTYNPADQSGQENHHPGGETAAAMTAALKNWQTMVSAMTSPDAMASLSAKTDTMPEMATKVTQAVMGSFSKFQKQMSQGADPIGEAIKGSHFEGLDGNGFRLWSGIYEKEFQKFFQIPQLGLTREYQERINTLMDRFHLFQADQAEFLRLLSLPFQDSMKAMQEKITSLAEKGKLPGDSNAYYQMWVKDLEGQFMTLFQTSEYIDTLTKTIGSLTKFSAAKNAVVEDMLKGLPIARQSEMDDLAREVYELKRAVRRLKKEKQQC
ncbi:MAG: poly(R)-hydroxyalkanoic acid synthase subunit PhaE [Desulfobacteraceae bacterium]